MVADPASVPSFLREICNEHIGSDARGTYAPPNPSSPPPQAHAFSTAWPGHLRAAALAALPPAAAARVAWTDARFPTILDPSVLRGLVHSLGLSRTRLLSDDSAPTLLERSSGNWEDVMAGLGDGPGGDVLSMAAAFRTHVAPSAAAPSTRSKD